VATARKSSRVRFSLARFESFTAHHSHPRRFVSTCRGDGP